MKLLFIRHGQTDWNVDGKIQGSSDIELNEIGISQAEELSNKLIKDNYKFSKIYTSPLKRALKTAEILSSNTDVEFVAINELTELNLGDWEGLSWAEVKDKFPKEYGVWYKDRKDTKTPKGESYQDMLDRVLKAIKNIINENTSDVVVVSHSAVIMSLQCILTETPFDKMTKFKLDNTAIVEINSKVITEYFFK